MQWRGAFLVATCAGIFASAPLAKAAATLAEPPLDSPVDVLPLSPMRLTGGFGELRGNHFHAGLDLSTGGRVGAPVRAPLPCSVERVRASGVGYGRSLYVRARDGRLLVFGHLDAFAPALAAYVDSVQRASGQYEQDLWPALSRFAYAAGETIAWTGESGAGPPHLHWEIRHGDFALSPLRAGASVADDGAPVIVSVTLEPLTPGSRVQRRVSPFTWRPGMSDTLLVEGDVRAIVRARSGMAGAEDVPAWSTAIEWGQWRAEARLDSISWAGEMAQLDWIVDRGRINGSLGMVLWAAPGARPRFLRTNVPEGVNGLTLHPATGDAAAPLRVTARDVNAREAVRTLWLRAPRAGEAAADTVDGRAVTAGAKAAAPRWECFALPDARLLRVRMSGAPAGLRGVRFALDGIAARAHAATWDGQAWSAIVPLPSLPFELAIRATASGGAWSARWRAMVWPAGADLLVQHGALAGLSLPADGVFEPGVVVTSEQPLAGALARVLVQPGRLPLAKAAPVRMQLPAGASPAGVGLYRRQVGGDWDFVRSTYDSSTRTLRGDSPTLGEFALLRDATPPVVRLLAPARKAPRGAYPRWQLVASVSDALSGIEASRSHFLVDGRVVPSEWDPELRQLRWRPLQPPAPGRHAYEVRVSDRAGLRASKRGTFVLDSATQ